MWNEVIGALRNLVNDIINPPDLLSALQPMVLISIFYGITPLYIGGRPGNRVIQSSWLGVLNITVRLILYAYVFLNSLTTNKSILGYFFQTHIARICDNLQKVNGVLSIAINLSISIGKRLKLRRCMLLLAEVEQRWRRLGISFNYKRSILFTLRPTIILTTANIGFGVISICGLMQMNGIRPPFEACVSFFSPGIVMAGFVNMFVCLGHMFDEMFDQLNSVLKNLSNQWENRKIRSISAKSRSLNCLDSFSMYTIVTKNPCEIIHESMEIHHLICDAASTANKYFTYQLLTIISIAFLIIVFDAYYVLETLLGKSKRESKFKTVEFVTFFSCQMILYLIAIISIVEGSNRAIKKSEKTGGIIHSLLNKAKNPDVKEKLQQFSMQLVHLKINFTAAGLFNIDRTLYFTISGALTTYLIILLQFTSSTPPNSRAPCIFMQNGTNVTLTGNGN